MRLPADRREWLETACRAGAFALLVYLVFRALVPPVTDMSEKVTVVGVSDLARLTREVPARIHFTLNAVPTAMERAWQKSLRSAGSSIAWSGNLSPIAISAKPVASPQGGYSAVAYAPLAETVKFSDAISLIDSVTPQANFAGMAVPIGADQVRVASDKSSAAAALNDSALLRRVLVIGRAGWETKFVLAALEESGWKADANVLVAPNVAVNQRATTSIDTAHYSAVVAVDESAALRAGEIKRFVQSGGGLVLGDAAARAPELAQLRVSSSVPPVLSTPVSDTISRASAPFLPLHIRANATALEFRGRAVSVGAMRYEFGRVAQTAFGETWRWRMQGNSRSLADHRDWWSNLVSQVAYAPHVHVRDKEGDPTPFSDLIAVAGSRAKAPPSSQPFSDGLNQMVWIIALFALLMIEWSSRRLRGVR